MTTHILQRAIDSLSGRITEIFRHRHKYKDRKLATARLRSYVVAVRVLSQQAYGRDNDVRIIPARARDARIRFNKLIDELSTTLTLADLEHMSAQLDDGSKAPSAVAISMMLAAREAINRRAPSESPQRP